MPRILTEIQVRQYEEEGYLVVEDVIPEHQVRAMRSALAEVVERSKVVTQHDDVFDLEDAHSAVRPRVRRIKKPHCVHPAFYAPLESPRLQGILQDLLGPNVRLNSSKLNLKSAEIGSPVEWHQDYVFYPHTNADLLAVGVLLDDATPENGPLLALPGSHRWGLLNHSSAEGYFAGAIDPVTCGIDFSSAVPFLGRTGACSFHHAFLIHGSAQNTSPRDRALLLYEVAAADAFPLIGNTRMSWEEFHGRMICGVDTVAPRLERLNALMPWPPAPHQGSIYENQRSARSYFQRQGV